MSVNEIIELEIKTIDANTHHGVIPASLAKEIIFNVAHSIIEDVRKWIDSKSEK